MQIAFRDYLPGRGITESPWVGWKYFVKFFSGVKFWPVLRNTLAIGLYSVAVLPCAVSLALGLNYLPSKGFRKTVQTISYMPHFISMVVVCSMVRLFTDGNSFIVQILSFFGHNNLGGNLLNEKSMFVPIYVVSGIWQEFGWGSIIYIAALAGVNQELYEAAVIDGASRLKQIWHVSLPGIRSTIVIMLIMRMGGMMSSNTDKVLLMQNALTYDVSDIIGTYVYRRGIQDADYSYSTAVGLFNSLINVVFVVTANTISKRLGESSLW